MHETAPRPSEVIPAAVTPDRVLALRLLPSLLIHLGCLGVLWVGASWSAVALCAALYLVRMFAITGFYHRYFSHRTFSTSRAAQFAFAALGASSAQRGPLWWAAHHRAHHRHSDDHPDPHSPTLRGLIWSHMGWFFSDAGSPTRTDEVRDLARFPELRWIDRWHLVPVIALGAACFAVGALADRLAPSLGMDGWQALVWGFFVSTTVLHHATFTINSLAHLIGTRRYETGDDSRNNLLLAIVTLGEGWHNNHHFNPGSTRQGFYWWEIDLTYYALVMMSRLGIVWDLRAPGQRVYDAAHRARLDRAA